METNRYPGCPEQGADDAATTRNAASSAPASGHGAGAPTHPPANEQQESEAVAEDVLEELTAQARRADQYLQLAKRLKADFENYRNAADGRASAPREGCGI